MNQTKRVIEKKYKKKGKTKKNPTAMQWHASLTRLADSSYFQAMRISF